MITNTLEINTLQVVLVSILSFVGACWLKKAWKFHVKIVWLVWFVVLSAIFNNISLISYDFLTCTKKLSNKNIIFIGCIFLVDRFSRERTQSLLLVRAGAILYPELSFLRRYTTMGRCYRAIFPPIAISPLIWLGGKMAILVRRKKGYVVDVI